MKNGNGGFSLGDIKFAFYFYSKQISLLNQSEIKGSVKIVLTFKKINVLV